MPAEVVVEINCSLHIGTLPARMPKMELLPAGSCCRAALAEAEARRLFCWRGRRLTSTRVRTERQVLGAECGWGCPDTSLELIQARIQRDVARGKGCENTSKLTKLIFPHNLCDFPEPMNCTFPYSERRPGALQKNRGKKRELILSPAVLLPSCSAPLLAHNNTWRNNNGVETSACSLVSTVRSSRSPPPCDDNIPLFTPSIVLSEFAEKKNTKTL